MPTPAPPSPLVRLGWDHLRLERPLAAWACWQRALRVDPGDEAARQALDALEGSPELPAAARASYRFQAPADPGRRARWDLALRARDLEDLAAAADAFAGLAAADPDDADARLNLALGLAWLGRNPEAVAALDDAVRLLVASDPERAADAWTLAEVLRAGAGAEPLADDLRCAWTVEGPDAPTGDLTRLWPDLVAAEVPDDPLTGAPALDRGLVYEWLDRPEPDPARPAPPRAWEVPRRLAAVVQTPGLLRASSPDPTGFERLDETRYAEAARLLEAARKEASPLPLAWADAALGAFRIPPGLTPEARAELGRSVVEFYYENLWIHRPRTALGGRTPAASARGDASARARLAGVVRYREQLGARPAHLAVYHGYPFDRLRRRLGLLPAGALPATLDPADPTCMSEAELDALDPAALDADRLADALESAAPFGDDRRTARFAAEWLGRPRPDPQGRPLDPAALVAPLVRLALAASNPDEALARIEDGRSACPPAAGRTLTVWSAEVRARAGDADAALDAYRRLIDETGGDPLLDPLTALDGGETLLDNGFPDHARPLLEFARTRGGPATRARAAVLLLDHG